MAERILIGVVGILLLNTNVLGFGTGPTHKDEEKMRAVAVLDIDTGFLGVTIRDIRAGDVSELSLPAERGVYINSVDPESPAEEAGLQEGDVILEYAGDLVSSARQFQRLVKETPPGREVQLKVWRAGTATHLTAELGERAGDYTWFGEHPRIHIQKKIIPDGHDFRFDGHDLHMAKAKPRLGIQVAPLTGQMADFLGIPGKEGVLILETLASMPAEAAGLQAGDVILSINGHDITSPSELIKHIQDGVNEIEFARDKGIKSLEVTVGEDEPESEEEHEM